MSEQQFILDIEWSRSSSDSIVLPSLVGTFESREEARAWGDLNIPNGVWECRPITWPWLRAMGERPARSSQDAADDAGDPCPRHRALGVNRDCPDCDQPSDDAGRRA